VFGDRPVDRVDTADVLKVHTPIRTTKAETARRITQRVRTVLDWAKASGYREGDNPADAITRALPKQTARVRHLPALADAEISKFLETLRHSMAAPSVSWAFEFLVLTAARTSEVLGARWAELDQAGLRPRVV
jgi:integrase